MKKRRMLVTMAAVSLLSFASCGKKSKTIDDYDIDNDTNISSEAATVETNDSNEPVHWSEKYTLSDSKITNVIVRVDYENADDEKQTISTVKFEEMNKDYIKNLCDKVFDSEPIVYDANAKTKRYYEDKIKLNEDCLNIYNQFMPGNKDNIEKINKNINTLKDEMENAPENVDNDYSYGGYIGNINGTEYYMCLGNRNFDEMTQLPTTFAFDGRIISLFRSDSLSMFNSDDSNSFKGSYNDDQIAEANKVRYFEQYPFDSSLGWPKNIENKANSKQDVLLEKAKEFVNQLGFSDYMYNGQYYNILYYKGVDRDVFRALEVYDENLEFTRISDFEGYAFVFSITGETSKIFGSYDLIMPAYTEKLDCADPRSYISVYVTDNGVVGCSITNPATLIKSEDVSSIISFNDFKDIYQNNYNDESIYNIPTNSEATVINLENILLTSFPIKSDEKGVYKYVPAYLLYSKFLAPNSPFDSKSYQRYIKPFVLVNAIDGSIIKIEDNLTDYPGGFYRGNESMEIYFGGIQNDNPQGEGETKDK
ncbi:hypothetical protein [Eubacterium ruminantium]|uniref:hypothetical protein n=1 Tax=Eubacterium ruminantium TaxID=42322 RepID=UPI002478D5EB|nr:hypothetical protein [Eubacterium ruminantium]